MNDDRLQVPFRLTKEKIDMIDVYKDLANISTRNSFIEEAIDFYGSYLMTKGNRCIAPAISSSIDGRIQLTEDRISKLIFKNTVEISMMMNIIAATTDLDEDTLKKLRQKCIRDIKSSNGKISFDEILRYQKS